MKTNAHGTQLRKPKWLLECDRSRRSVWKYNRNRNQQIRLCPPTHASSVWRLITWFANSPANSEKCCSKRTERQPKGKISHCVSWVDRKVRRDNRECSRMKGKGAKVLSMARRITYVDCGYSVCVLENDWLNENWQSKMVRIEEKCEHEATRLGEKLKKRKSRRWSQARTGQIV